MFPKIRTLMYWFTDIIGRYISIFVLRLKLFLKAQKILGLVI